MFCNIKILVLSVLLISFHLIMIYFIWWQYPYVSWWNSWNFYLFRTSIHLGEIKSKLSWVIKPMMRLHGTTLHLRTDVRLLWCCKICFCCWFCYKCSCYSCCWNGWEIDYHNFLNILKGHICFTLKWSILKLDSIAHPVGRLEHKWYQMVSRGVPILFLYLKSTNNDSMRNELK